MSAKSKNLQVQSNNNEKRKKRDQSQLVKWSKSMSMIQRSDFLSYL